MADALVTGALPKSRAGRQAQPMDESLVKALTDHLTKTPFVKDEEGNDRPNFGGPGTEFETQGKAASAGRRYAKAVAAKLNSTVRVNVYDNGKNGNSKRHLWRIYVPVSEMPEEGDATEETSK